MIRKAFAKLHRNEEGIEALQAVLVMAVAAVVLALVRQQWPTMKQYFIDKTTNITTFAL